MYLKQRKGDNKLRVTVEDIINTMCEVDKAGQRDKLPTFCAVQRTRIPVIVDEVSDIAAMRTEISELRKRFEAVADQMNEIMLKQSVESWPPLSHAMGVGARQTEVSKNNSHERSLSTTVRPNTAPVSVLPVPVGELDTTEAAVETNNFTVVRNKKRDKRAQKNMKFVVGGSTDIKFQGVAKKTIVFVNRLDPSTTTDIVQDHLAANGIKVLSCFRITPKGLEDSKTPRFIGMRLCVPFSYTDAVYSPEMWPDGVTVRPWVFKSVTDEQQLQPENSSGSNEENC